MFRRLLCLVLFIAAVHVPRRVRAQACCAGASTFGAARLDATESGAVGLSMRGSAVAGSFDPAGRYRSAAAGSKEAELEGAVVAMRRLGADTQLAVTVPFVATYRAVAGLSDAGSGLGDLQLALRWDGLAPGASAVVPGIAWGLSTTLPTGVAPERARHPLAADATGLGAATAAASLTLEQPFERLMLQASAGGRLAASRWVDGHEVRAGRQQFLSVSVGWAFRSGGGAAVALQHRADAASSFDGAPVASSERATTTVGLSGGAPLASRWRWQASALVPTGGGGNRRSLATPTAQLLLLRTWP
ncbi:MAG: hypothetical protein RL199_375 [Pseudomonadota bacterium]|jgi:hypothetical protein